MEKVAHFVSWTTFDGDMTNPSGRVIRSDFFLVGYFVTLKKEKNPKV
jgi:hypothetical protein